MKRKPYNKIFNNQEKLQEMLYLYDKGASLSDLARTFGVDHSSISYQVKKHNLPFTEREYKKGAKLKNKAGFCKICEMRLDSDYHKIPCE